MRGYYEESPEVRAARKARDELRERAREYASAYLQSWGSSLEMAAAEKLEAAAKAYAETLPKKRHSSARPSQPSSQVQETE